MRWMVVKCMGKAGTNPVNHSPPELLQFQVTVAGTLSTLDLSGFSPIAAVRVSYIN